MSFTRSKVREAGNRKKGLPVTRFSSNDVRGFQKVVWEYYAGNARRELPWRKTRDPYLILVSEVMLQQTQVERVLPFYENFIKKFPTVQTLAAAPLADVLKAWQGLGYNSRAKRLQDAAKQVVEKHGGKLPKDAASLETLPGIGPYTARAIEAFAHNTDSVFIETNIRTVVQHHFFSGKEGVDDQEIVEVLKRALPIGSAREWYSALMDYGAHLKRSGVRINSKSKLYTKQSKFSGSAREARGAILKSLAKAPNTAAKLTLLLGDHRKAQLEEQLQKLLKEGLVQKIGRTYRLPQ